MLCASKCSMQFDTLMQSTYGYCQKKKRWKTSFPLRQWKLIWSWWEYSIFPFLKTGIVSLWRLCGCFSEFSFSWINFQPRLLSSIYPWFEYEVSSPWRMTNQVWKKPSCPGFIIAFLQGDLQSKAIKFNLSRSSEIAFMSHDFFIHVLYTYYFLLLFFIPQSWLVLVLWPSSWPCYLKGSRSPRSLLILNWMRIPWPEFKTVKILRPVVILW